VEADLDFYKIDHNLFAPAKLMINNAKTGKVFEAGKITGEALRKAFGFG
jgi:methenyltetrahydromethanopterin cyclohydrolase